MRGGTAGALLAGIFSVAGVAPVAVSAATPTPFIVATSASAVAYQRSAQDKVAYLHDGSLLVGYWNSNSPAGAYINQVTNPSTAPVSKNVLFISGGDEVSIYTVPGGSSTEIWIQVGSELDGLPKLEQVQHGTYSGGTFTWTNGGTPYPIPGALTTGRQDPSLTWTGKWLVATWWDDTMGGNSDNIFYNWTTDKTGASGWAVSAKSGTVNTALVIKNGTTGAATIAGATAITYATSGAAPGVGDLFEFGNGTINSEARQVTTVAGIASPYTLTVAALTNAHAMGEVDTTATRIAYNAVTGTAPAVGDWFQIGKGNNCPCDAELRQVTAVTGAAPYVLTVAALSNAHAAAEEIRVEAKELSATASNSVQVAIRHSSKLGATIAVYGAACQILTRTLLDSATDPSPLNWTTESVVDSNDDCENNFGGPQIAIDENNGNIHVFKAVTNSQGSTSWGITYWLGHMSGGTVSWNSQLVVDSAASLDGNDPPDIAGAVDSTGKVYIFWSTSVTNGAIKFVTLVSPYTSASPETTIPTFGTQPRYPHVPAQAPLTGGYVPLVYQSGTGSPYSIILDTRYPDTTPPTVPTGLTGTTTTKPSVILNWTASTDNFGVTGYTIYRGGAMLGTVSGTTLTYTDTTVSGLTNYTYTLDAFDAAGNHSAQSVPLSLNTPDSTPPSVPTGLHATVTPTPQVNLSWSASSDNVGVTGYTIYRNGSMLTTVAGATLTYTDLAVTQVSSYSYAVDAFDAAGNHSAQSAPVSVGTPDISPPTVPAGLTATPTFTHQVNLSWSASTDNVGVTGYTIYRNGSSLTTVSGSTLNYADTTVLDVTTYSYTVDAFDAASNHSAQSAPASATTPDTSGLYHPLAPQRVLDTRLSGRTLGSGGSVNLALGGVSVPSNATAVVLNVTATNTSTDGAFIVYPTGGLVPLASNLNWVAHETVPNLVMVRLGSGGLVTIFNGAGSADAVVDLEGYYAPPSGGTAGGFVSLSPSRITDTRPGSGQANAGSTLGSGGSLNVQVSGAGGVPATGAEAVVLNVTVTNTTAPGALVAYPTGSFLPLASNLNWVAGTTVPNRVIVPIGAGGKVTFFNGAGSADLVIDVSGYFTDSTAGGSVFVGVPPARIADTRYGIGGFTSPVGQGATLVVQVAGVGGVPTMGSATPPKAVVLNVTVQGATAASDLVVWPGGSSLPVASDLNFQRGQTVPNLVVVKLSATGTVSITNDFGSTNVIVDVVGWYGG